MSRPDLADPAIRSRGFGGCDASSSSAVSKTVRLGPIVSNGKHMLRRVGPWLRDRIDVVDIGISLLLAVLFSELGFASLLELVVVLVIGAPIVQAALDRLDPDPGLLWLTFGLFWVAGGVVQLRDGGPRVGAVLLAIGSWICLDGLYAWKHDDSVIRGGDAADQPDDDLTTDEVVRLTNHNRRVVETLRDADRPLAEAELRSRTGLDEADLERVLTYHEGSGSIDRVGNGYVLDESETGFAAMLRTAAGLVVGRLLRPFRLLRPAG